jgi:hypothetical protein
MIRKTLVAVALAVMCTLGATGVASAETAPAAPSAPPLVPVFYFGTQIYCTQAGAMGQQTGALQPGAWMCDSGWLLVQPQMG